MAIGLILGVIIGGAIFCNHPQSDRGASSPGATDTLIKAGEPIYVVITKRVRDTAWVEIRDSTGNTSLSFLLTGPDLPNDIAVSTLTLTSRGTDIVPISKRSIIPFILEEYEVSWGGKIETMVAFPFEIGGVLKLYFCYRRMEIFVGPGLNLPSANPIKMWAGVSYKIF